MNKEILQEKKVDNKDGQITGVLFELQEIIDGFKAEIDGSYELHKIGVKTKLTLEIEKTIDNPLKELFSTSQSLDNTITNVIDRIVRSFLTEKKKLIKTAVKTLPEDLHYSIILNEDNYENRISIYSFFDLFGSNEISVKFPVFFQFIPEKYSGNIVKSEIIL